jgi:hypothetical protein
MRGARAVRDRTLAALPSLSARRPLAKTPDATQWQQTREAGQKYRQHGFRACLANAKERQHRSHDDHQTDNVDNIVHSAFLQEAIGFS